MILSRPVLTHLPWTKNGHIIHRFENKPNFCKLKAVPSTHLGILLAPLSVLYLLLSYTVINSLRALLLYLNCFKCMNSNACDSRKCTIIHLETTVIHPVSIILDSKLLRTDLQTVSLADSISLRGEESTSRAKHCSNTWVTFCMYFHRSKEKSDFSIRIVIL